MSEPTAPDTDVLVIIDPQNDFCPGGALAVPDGDAVIEPINRIARRFRHVVITQDWHPPNQISFASFHDATPFSLTDVTYGAQVLWPDHCVQGTPGADFHPALHVPQAELILRKGYNPSIDSYSAFFENDRTTPTGLAGYLRERGFKRCVFVGLALDFCVRYSAEDAVREGFAATVIVEACRAIAMPSPSGNGTTLDEAMEAFRALGVECVRENQ
jgi:nicotinamidase/pyrazinamidase